MLYPTNALVEDQITRLRRALRYLAGADTRLQLWFGRYTGSTLGTGDPPRPGVSDQRVRELAAQLRSMTVDYDRLLDAGLDDDLRSQFPDPRQGEMVTRWDMIASPPDVLVTNYSMLNAMLMRDIEDPLFEQTREWVQSGGVFTLVVDELHLYRGTAGSEVAMTVRNLLSRIGIDPRSPQLRCIATSASLTAGDEGRAFLEGFFGVESSSFFVTAGSPRALSASLPIDREEILRVAANDSREEGGLERFAKELRLPAAVAEACRPAPGARHRATKLSDVASRLFGEPDPDGEAMEHVLEALSRLEGDPDSITFRAHMFARTMRGIWACTNPDCDQVSAERLIRGVGKLYGIPTSTCSCGGRVLELLYCFECGDVSVGGFVVAREQDGTWLLSSTPVEVPTTGADLVFRRPHGRFVWYRPGVLPLLQPWTHSGVSLSFATARWDPLLGALLPGGTGPTGMVLAVSGLPVDDESVVPALPEVCPRCELRTGRNKPRPFFRGIVRSPIRAHTAGLAQATQLLLSQLLRAMGSSADESKTIVFTDSRDDAARTAVGVEQNHFRDLVRQVVRTELNETRPSSSEVARRVAMGTDLIADEAAVRDQLLRENSDV